MTILTASLVVGFCMFLQSCLSVQLVGPATACLLGVQGLSVRASGLVLIVSRPVCTNHPNPKAGWPLDTDKPACIMSGRGGETDPQISHLLLWICVTDPRLLQPPIEL